MQPARIMGVPRDIQQNSLIDVGWLTFQEDDPNVKTNLLANHGGSAVNAIEECGLQRPKQLKDVITSRRFILMALREVGINGSPCNVGVWVQTQKGFRSEQRRRGELGRVQREPWKVQARI